MFSKSAAPKAKTPRVWLRIKLRQGYLWLPFSRSSAEVKSNSLTQLGYQFAVPSRKTHRYKPQSKYVIERTVSHIPPKVELGIHEPRFHRKKQVDFPKRGFPMFKSSLVQRGTVDTIGLPAILNFRVLV